MRGERCRRILITGSSGQIGTNLGLRLLAEGHDVVGVDVRANSWSDAIPTTLLDLSDGGCSGGEVIAAAVGEPVDLVVHLAAGAKVHSSVCEPEGACANVLMAHAVLEYCRLGATPIIQSSSREVYGNLPNAVVDESLADFTRVLSPYAAGKLAVESFIHAYSRCFELRYLICRLSNVYGRYDSDHERMERVVPHFIDHISRGEPVTVFGEAKLLDFTYVDDVVEALRRGSERLLRGEALNTTINVARGEGHSLVDLARMIGEAVGREPEIRLKPAQVGEVTRYVADTRRCAELLGWNAEVGLREGVGRAVAWKRSLDSSLRSLPSAISA